MKFHVSTMHLSTLALFASVAVSLPSDYAPTAPRAPRAVYFLTNDADNAVVALSVAYDGTLFGGCSTSTGGAGSNGFTNAAHAIAGPDALFSQSSLTISERFIFAVNAGSNTLSMLSISARDPTLLTLLGAAAAIPGQFPTTVAASAKHGLVCVGTTGAQAGVSCASYSDDGLSSFDALRVFDLDQSTPPIGPLNTVSQVLFSADESSLLVTVKSNPGVLAGFLAIFPVQYHHAREASISRDAVHSSPNGTAVLFGAAPIPGTTDIFVTDASFGAGILAIDPYTSVATLVAKQTIPGQKATCWATVSRHTKTGFVSDPASGHVTEMRLDTAAIVTSLDFSAHSTGLIDLRAARDFVYVLAAGNVNLTAAVLVLDVSAGPGSAHLAQRFDLAHLHAGVNSEGIAVLH